MLKNKSKEKIKSDEIEQLRVQLAGCSVAALGWAKGKNSCKKGQYGCSVAFQDVMDLRLKYEKLLKNNKKEKVK